MVAVLDHVGEDFDLFVVVLHFRDLLSLVPFHGLSIAYRH
jgi:hypothetical protein